MNYYRKFVKGCSSLVQPLTRLLHKNQDYNWTNECDETFRHLKKINEKDAVLSFPDFTKIFYLHTDASNVAVGLIFYVLYKIKNSYRLRQNAYSV